MNYRFNEDQQRRLTALELHDRQIEQLQREVLPAAAAALSDEPTISDVRDKLREVSKAISAARDATASLLNAAGEGHSTPAWREVFQRIERADFVVTAKDQGDELHCNGGEPVLTDDGWLCPPSLENDQGERDTERYPGESVERAYRALAPLSNIVRRASEALEREAAEITQRRPGTWFPVQIIDAALRNGSLEHHQAREGGDGVPHDLQPSTSETSTFFKIVAICYEAIGQEERSLEAPIRAYINWLGKKEQPQ